MIQSVHNELRKKQTFDELCGLAEQAEDFPSLLDVNDPAFLAPQSMSPAVKDYCQKSGQPVPNTLVITDTQLFDLCKTFGIEPRAGYLEI